MNPVFYKNEWFQIYIQHHLKIRSLLDFFYVLEGNLLCSQRLHLFDKYTVKYDMN